MPRLIVHGFTISLESSRAKIWDGAHPHRSLTRNALRMLALFLLATSVVQVFAQEDRRSLPTRFTITLENGNRMESRKFTPEMRDAISLKGIKAAQIRFKTGEVVHLDYDKFGQVVVAMSIQLGERRCLVPDSVMADINPLLIGTLELSWDGDSKRASSASYFTIHYMRMNERRVPGDPLIFLRDCSRIGGLDVLEDRLRGLH
jgi:hypothetical protein